MLPYAIPRILRVPAAASYVYDFCEQQLSQHGHPDLVNGPDVRLPSLRRALRDEQVAAVELPHGSKFRTQLRSVPFIICGEIHPDLTRS